MAVGLPGLCKVDQFDVAQGKNDSCQSMLLWSPSEESRRNQTIILSFAASFKILEALQMAEDYMEKTADFSGRVSENQHTFLLSLDEFLTAGLLLSVRFKGFIIQNSEKKPSMCPDQAEEELLTYDPLHI